MEYGKEIWNYVWDNGIGNLFLSDGTTCPAEHVEQRGEKEEEYLYSSCGDYYEIRKVNLELVNGDGIGNPFLSDSSTCPAEYVEQRVRCFQMLIKLIDGTRVGY